MVEYSVRTSIGPKVVTSLADIVTGLERDEQIHLGRLLVPLHRHYDSLPGVG
jgi:hypothetical protein